MDIDNISVRHLENIDISKILRVFIEFPQNKKGKREYLKSYVDTRFKQIYSYDYEKKDENKSLAVYSDFYYREDHKKIFEDFIKAFPYFDYVIPIRMEAKINIKRAIRIIWFDLFSWRVISKLDYDKYIKIRLFIVLGLIFNYSKTILGMIDLSKYNFALAYSDSCPYENLLIQELKIKGITTATLQHGLCNPQGYYKGIELRTSVADEFLAWNTYTRDKALELGINNVNVLGIPRYISGAECKPVSEEIFCVILGDKKSHKDNLFLIECANHISEKMGLLFYLRLHPSNKNEEYLTLAESEFCQGERQESIADMCRKTKFCLVVSGTSVFIDLIYFRHTFYEFAQEEKKYRTFSTINELDKLIMENNTITDSIFNYYCTTDNVYKSYDNYFRGKGLY